MNEELENKNTVSEEQNTDIKPTTGGKLSNQPQKGMYDWLPEDFVIRKYIFDTWRRVCKQYGYQEYLTPLLEDAAIYRAKSGEDVGGKELMICVDQAGRELAVRPEMTPSVTRLVSKIYESVPKPIRLFSIANFIRNEKPQRGRNREFWQLNFDIFGGYLKTADLEILEISIEIMIALCLNAPPAGSFTVRLNDRRIVVCLLSDVLKVEREKWTGIIRTMDKWEKLKIEAIEERLENLGLDQEQQGILKSFMNSRTIEEIETISTEFSENNGFKTIKELIEDLTEGGYGAWIEFSPNVIRGFDYYDGMIFEVFDNSPDNNRAMFGGGRYDGLGALFEKASFGAVGAAPGDETAKLFLESWGLIEKIRVELMSQEKRIYLPRINEELSREYSQLARKLRKEGYIVELGTSGVRIGDALRYADKQGFNKVVILDEREKAEGIFVMKDLQSGEEERIGL